MITLLPISEFMATTKFALNEELASVYKHFCMIPQTISTVVAFAGVLILKASQGQKALESALATSRASTYINFLFDYLLKNDIGRTVSCLIEQCQSQVSQELQTLLEARLSEMSKERKGLLLGQHSAATSPHSWHLQLSALASVFEVSFLMLTGKNVYSLPVFTSRTGEFPVVPLMCWEGASVVFIGDVNALQVPDRLLSLLQHVDMVQRLLREHRIQDQEYALIQEFRAEWKEVQPLAQQIKPKLDSVAQLCLLHAESLHSALACQRCSSQNSVRLQCSHWVCSSCVFKGQNWKPHASAACPECSQAIQLNDIRTLLADDRFSEALLKVKEAGSAVCSKCGQVAQVVQWHPLSCGHDACFPCLVVAVRTKTVLCGLCQSFPSEEHISFIKQKEMMCSFCERQQNVVRFPTFHCSDHWICLDCFSIKDVCAGCSRPLTAEEQKAISRCFFKCQICKSNKNRVQLHTGTVCGCRVCKDCFDLKLKENVNITECFVCRSHFPEPTIDQNYRRVKELVNSIEIPELEELEKRRSAKRAPCAVCDQADREEKVRLACDHIVHIVCLAHRLADQRIRDLSPACPVCVSAVDVSQINSGFVHSVFPGRVTCPKCAGNVVEVNATIVKCEAENVSFCRKCEMENPENHQENDCAMLRRQLMTAKLGKFTAKDISCFCVSDKCELCRHIAQCPKCKAPHQKKQGQREVCCLVCKSQFCHGCSALMDPIRLHGDLWHRPQCPFSPPRTPEAGEIIAKVKKAATCPSCEAEGKCCAPPNDLPVRGQFLKGHR